MLVIQDLPFKHLIVFHVKSSSVQSVLHLSVNVNLVMMDTFTTAFKKNAYHVHQVVSHAKPVIFPNVWIVLKDFISPKLMVKILALSVSTIVPFVKTVLLALNVLKASLLQIIKPLAQYNVHHNVPLVAALIRLNASVAIQEQLLIH